ncbi:MAG: RtcB family protein, partial [Pyramidobacter sp.]|nr:RtcB family protein [Pyramidobacter sp.]
MKQIQGRFNTAVSFAATLDARAEEQIRAVCDVPQFAGCKIRIMPDVHAGKGCTIGTTMTLTDKVVPGMVVVDIGCGMETVRLAERSLDCAALDALIRSRIPCGRNVRDVPHPFNEQIDLG